MKVPFSEDYHMVSIVWCLSYTIPSTSFNDLFLIMFLKKRSLTDAYNSLAKADLVKINNLQNPMLVEINNLQNPM